MKKITLDGIEYEASPEVINALGKATGRVDELNDEVKNLTDSNSKIQADHDTMKEKLDKAEKHDSSEEIKKGVESRLALITEATPHLDEETVKNVADMSDAEIKKAVIMTHFPEAKLDGKEDAYLEARYDSALEVKTEKSDEAMAEQRKKINGDGANSEKTVNADEAQKNFVNTLVNAWKPEK